jgi:hypothetical protein
MEKLALDWWVGRKSEVRNCEDLAPRSNITVLLQDKGKDGLW